MLSFREVIFLFFFNIFSFDCLAIDYFISQSAGNDDNSGISPAAAIKSLTRVNNLSLSPGDALYFHKGYQCIFKMYKLMRNQESAYKLLEAFD